MAVARLRKELLAIDKEELGSNWTDKVQAVASAAEAAALMESGAVPIVAKMIQTETGAEPPTWTWSTGPATEDNFFKWSATLCSEFSWPGYSLALADTHSSTCSGWCNTFRWWSLRHQN
jgi:hypothetical protein